MNINSSEFVSIKDIGVAYRKAKVDAYYSTVLIRSDFVAYEKDLKSNLRQFEHLIIQKPDEILLGDWVLVPKGIEADSCETLVYSSPDDQWTEILRSKNCSRPKAEFRLMAQPSVEFHLLSALWILKVGHLYDSKLGSSAYGNRLRRKRDGLVNKLSIGSFMPYPKPFRDWRDNGINALQDALKANKRVVAITADVNGFYHELHSGFLLTDKFLDSIELKLNADERLLTEVFVAALERWAQSTPLKKGLPVGLPASGLVANMALFELDRAIEREVVPLYYGRYVDDIMLAIENTSNFMTQEDVWEWVFKRVNRLLRWTDEKQVAFVPDYLSNSKIEFSNNKNKVFIISGDSGRNLIDSIAHQIHLRASEWRALPDLPKDPAHIPTVLVQASKKDGEAADNLREVDSLILRRAGFAIKLRDFEAYERDLPPSAWEKHRHAFLNTFTQHVLALPTFFDLADYLPRVIRIATSCEDFELLRKLLDRLFELVERVFENSENKQIEIKIKCYPEENDYEPSIMKQKWMQHLIIMVYESIQAAFPYRLSRDGAQAWMKHFGNDTKFAEKLNIDLSPRKLKAQQAELFVHDLAHMPFRFKGLPPELSFSRSMPPKKCILTLEAKSILPENITSGIGHVARLMRMCNAKEPEELPIGLLFATRPLNIQEIYILHPSPYDPKNEPELSDAILALRGFTIEKKIPLIEANGLLRIPLEKESDKYRIAVASWKTDHGSRTASIKKSTDPDTGRYSRLTHLMNEILASPNKIDYLIMPELSIPPGWFMRVARRLHYRGISLISGVEYLYRGRRRVMNQVWAALPHDGFGFPCLALYTQDKQRPALHEEQELFRVAGAILQPQKTWRTPPVLRHGNLQFGLLICSELTNITYRSSLRGRIDALFVPEWNQDTENFNSLVESASLDIHAYIIQCNDRQYGDSRIRVPHRDSWMRDQVRIKGGSNDYFVVGEIDIAGLRGFQSNHRSPSGPFKPMPDGFKISYERKTVPQKKNENE